jgi:outer membrane protein insertion porin family
VAIGALIALLIGVWPTRLAFAQAKGPDAGSPPAAAPATPPAAPAKALKDAGAPAVGDAGANATGDAAAGAAAGDAAPADQTGTDVAGAATTVRLPTTEGEKAEGENIVAIDVSGNRRVAREDVVSYLKLKVGQPFKMEALSSDVRALWDAGFFDDIEVDLQRTSDGVKLKFNVRERPNIKSIEVEGNDEIDTEKLSEVIEVKNNTILSVPAVRRSVQKIKDAYAEKGYFLAEVEYTIEPQRDNEVIVRFKVKEHQPVTVRRVSFIGNENVSESELREVMQTGQAGFFSFGSGGPYRQDVFERDVLMLSALYYDKGYMSVQIATPRVMLTPDREGIEITVVINEGPRFKIRQLRVYERDEDGKEIEPLGGRRALRLMVKAKSGDWFNRASIVKDLQAVRTLYRDAGYYFVEADPETNVDAAKREVDIVIPIRRGPLTRVERIQVKGNTKTRDKVIRREMEIAEGDLYSETKVEESKRRVTALGYFERVDVTTEQGSQSDRVIINFEIGERPTGTFQVGAGFSSVENFIATAQIQQANLFGSGQSLALQGQFSSLRQIVSIRFFEPYFFDSDWSFSTELFQQVYVFPDFSRQSIGGSLTYGYALVQPWLRLSLTGTVQNDKVSTAVTNTFFGTSSGFASVFQRLPLANLFNDGRTISLRPALIYDTRDNRLFPTSGLYLQLSTEWADTLIGSELEFLRHRFTGRAYYPLGGQTGQPGSGFVLRLNTELGYITSPRPEGVPIYQRFFLGGILDMRGYRLRTVGPRLPLNQSLDPNAAPIPDGARIGGNLQAYTNLELEFPIVDKVGIRGVVFTDVGNAWNTEDQFCKNTPAPQFPEVVQPCFSGSSLLNVRASSGFGIRWFSPLGPLRFEWGFPWRPLPFEENYVFEFTIGNFF